MVKSSPAATASSSRLRTIVRIRAVSWLARIDHDVAVARQGRRARYSRIVARPDSAGSRGTSGGRPGCRCSSVSGARSHDRTGVVNAA